MVSIKAIKRTICFAASIFLCSFVSNSSALSTVLLYVSSFALVVCIGYLIIKSLMRKDVGIFLLDDDTQYFWAGFFLLVAILFLNQHLYAYAIISGCFFVFYFVLMIKSFIRKD